MSFSANIAPFLKSAILFWNFSKLFNVISLFSPFRQNKEAHI